MSEKVDYLYWWFPRSNPMIPGMNGGPSTDLNWIRKQAEFWSSRQDASDTEYLILGVPVAYLELGGREEAE